MPCPARKMTMISKALQFVTIVRVANATGRIRNENMPEQLGLCHDMGVFSSMGQQTLAGLRVEAKVEIAALAAAWRGA